MELAFAEEHELVFRVKENSQRVGYLPSGKVVLVDLSQRHLVELERGS